MDTQITVRDIIAMWPSRADLAEDAHTPEDPVTVSAVHKWVQRNGIPSRYHAPILRGAERRNIRLTAAALIGAHERPRRAA